MNPVKPRKLFHILPTTVTVPIILFFLFFLFTASAVHSRSEYQMLSDQVIRLHIRADGNDAQSQTLKLLVRDALLENMQSYFSSCTTQAQALEIARQQSDSMVETAAQVLLSNDCSLPVSVQVSHSYFPYRSYGGVVYPAGIYPAVVVEIGSGEGHNWWCVMYPPLCFTDLCTDSASSLSLSQLRAGKVTVRFRYFRFLNRFFD